MYFWPYDFEKIPANTYLALVVLPVDFTGNRSGITGINRQYFPKTMVSFFL